jgi:hypothetical protein
VERVAAEAALTVEGIAAAFTRTQILSGGLPRTPLAERVQMAFHPQRSGDVFLVPEPFCFFGSEEYTTATTHGTPYAYDTHVPVILTGRGIRPGTYWVEASPSDIAPTLAALLGVTPPNGTVGRPLPEALSRQVARADQVARSDMAAFLQPKGCGVLYGVIGRVAGCAMLRFGHGCTTHLSPVSRETSDDVWFSGHHCHRGNEP